MPQTPTLHVTTPQSPSSTQQIITYVRDQLKAEGIPQRVLATELGISQGRVNRILNQRSTLYISQLFVIARLLSMTPGDILRAAVAEAAS